MKESEALGLPRSLSRSPKAKRTKEKSDESRSPIKRKRQESPIRQESDYRSSYSYSYTADENEVPKMPLYCEYKYRATNFDLQQWDECPKALLLFSGRPRDGDLACYLHKMGWIVVLVDLLGPVTTNLIDEKVAKEVTKDIQAGLFEVVGIATPCNTVSPLRETPPGPRPLRSLECPDGLPLKKLSQQERVQLHESNILFKFTSDTVTNQRKKRLSYWVEKPDHKDKLDIWKTSYFKNILGHALCMKTKFDQCTVGAETTKPTMLVSDDIVFDVLKDKGCRHPVQTWTKPDGSTYQAPHESLVQRWRVGASGQKERASKALGEYPPELNRIVAEAMSALDHPRVESLRKPEKGPGQK